MYHVQYFGRQLQYLECVLDLTLSVFLFSNYYFFTFLGLSAEEILTLIDLDESEYDYSDDSDNDPVYTLPRSTRAESDSSDSDTSSGCSENSQFVAPSPAISDSSLIHRASTSNRRHGGRRGRGTRARGSGSRISRRDGEIQDEWTGRTFHTQIQNMTQPAYFQQDISDWDYYNFYEQYIYIYIYIYIYNICNIMAQKSIKTPFREPGDIF
jgi:hypothetical protein